MDADVDVDVEAARVPEPGAQAHRLRLRRRSPRRGSVFAVALRIILFMTAPNPLKEAGVELVARMWRR